MSRKKISIISIIILIAFLLSIIYYHSNSSSKNIKEGIVENDAEALLEKALSLYEEKTVRGTETIYQSYYDDGTDEKEKELVIYDSTNKIISSSIEYADGKTYSNILTKEEDMVYSYIKDSSRDDNWIRYAEIPDVNNETTFDYLLQELTFSISEENGYSNISISKEGKDILNNVSSIKLKIVASLKATDGLENETTSTKVTREDIIEENGWSEVSVMAVDGFSDLLDDYVKYLNQPVDTPEATSEEYTIWINEETSQLLQIEGIITPNYSDETTSDVEAEFWDKCWEVSWIQADLDSGISLEDSLATLEDERDSIEAQMKNNIEQETENERELSLTQMLFTRTFLTDSSCPSIDTLPTDYVETTQEDYYNEYSEDEVNYIDGKYIESDFADDAFFYIK